MGDREPIDRVLPLLHAELHDLVDAPLAYRGLNALSTALATFHDHLRYAIKNLKHAPANPGILIERATKRPVPARTARTTRKVSTC